MIVIGADTHKRSHALAAVEQEPGGFVGGIGFLTWRTIRFLLTNLFHPKLTRAPHTSRRLDN